MVVFPKGGEYIGLLGAMVFQEGPGADEGDNVKQHMELTWSPDATTWHRIEPATPFIENTPGPEPPVYGEMPYDWECIFATAPVFLDNELRIYYGAWDWNFFDWRKGYLALATLRQDGWAGCEPIMDGSNRVCPKVT
jgi:hypothetical protein